MQNNEGGGRCNKIYLMRFQFQLVDVVIIVFRVVPVLASFPEDKKNSPDDEDYEDDN